MTFFVTFMCITVGVTVVGMVSFMRKDYMASSVCCLLAAIMWIPHFILDVQEGNWWMSVLMVILCFYVAIVSKGKMIFDLLHDGELVAFDETNGTFIMRFTDESTMAKVVKYVEDDSSVDGDTHVIIVCGNYIAVQTDSINRARGLSDELINKSGETK